MHTPFTLWMNFSHVQMIYILLTYMTVVNVYFTLYFYIFVCFMTCSTSYCLVTVSGIHGMYIVLYCIVMGQM